MRLVDGCISRNHECRCLDLLGVGIFEIIWDVKSGSGLAVKGSDGARYWMTSWAFRE